MPPTIAQQRGFAYAPIPFGVLSFLSSTYVIYYLLIKERQKLERLYHRLVLAMNFALLPLTFTYIWSTSAVPEGTPDYVGAVGSIATCTAQGFIFQTLSVTVPTYYGSLSLQGLLGIKNEFQEKKYRWIEIPIHIFAWCVPAAMATIVAVTENFNPNGSGCALRKAPHGCEADPLIPCERGEDIDILVYTVGLGVAFLYFVFPPIFVLAMYRWIKRMERKVKDSRGMHQIRHNARKQMVQQVAKQMSLYLFSFWFTIVPTLIDFVYHTLTGKTIYELLIFANCIFALQGFVMTMVYFALERSGEKPKLEGVAPDLVSTTRRSTFRDDRRTSVQDIQTNANKMTMSSDSLEINNVGEGRRESFGFNIFDGVPDENSPWAKFFEDEGSYDGDDALDTEMGVCVQNDTMENDNC